MLLVVRSTRLLSRYRWVAWLLLTLPLLTTAQPVDFTGTQSQVTRQVVNRLIFHHYRDLPIDDSLSEAFFEEYLTALDNGKFFFLQSDIDAFEKYRYTLDNALKKGNLTPAAEIFNRFEKRARTRLNTMLGELDTLVPAFNYTVEESLPSSREDAEWARTDAELDELWRKHLKAQALDLSIAGKPESEVIDLLRKRLESQLHHVERLNQDDVYSVYLNAMTQQFDPHTNYLSPSRSEQFNINMRLSLEGIGAVLQQDDLYIRVARLVHAGPAYKQGELQPDDRIVGVAQDDDGEMVDVIGWRLDDVVDLIRGPKGTVVRLEVIPALAVSDTERREIRIVRDEVKLEEQAAQKHVLEVDHNGALRRIGVIKVPAFYIDFEALYRGKPDYRSTTRDVRRLLRELKKENVEGVVIDLRENGGGSLREANELTGLFIDYGPTVQIRHANKRVFRQGKTPDGVAPVYRRPIVVLTNRMSASASEIFAGAIQDYQRGLVVGSPTFGKGTVQNLTDLKAGQLKLTVSKFYRVSGDSTQHRGVIPDIEFPSEYPLEDIGESAFPTALPWDRIEPVSHRTYYPVEALAPTLEGAHQKRIEENPDFHYLVQTLALSSDLDDNLIYLDRERREAQREARQKQALKIENTRRLAKGLEPLKNADALETVNGGNKDADEQSAEARKQRDDHDEAEAEALSLYSDAYLVEAGHILVDMIDALPDESVTAR